MKRVAASEALVLTVARAVVGAESPGAAEWILTQHNSLPDKMGPTSIALLRETLSTGMIFELARRGGAEPRPHLSVGTAGKLETASVKRGRLWERHPPPRLELSDYALQLLRWMVSMPLREKHFRGCDAEPKTAGDAYFGYLAFDLCARTFNTAAPIYERSFRAIPLVWSAFVDHLMTARAGQGPEDFSSLVQGDHAIIFEALQSSLAERWTSILKRCSTIESNEELLLYGRFVRSVLDRILNAIEAAARPDLARFFLQAAASILGAFAEPGRFVERLKKSGRLAEQVEARREALAFLPALLRLQAIAERARTAHFFDEHYEASQLYLNLWETVGEAKVQHAARMAQEIALD